MTTANTTLTSLWQDEGNASAPSTPAKVQLSTELREDLTRYFRDSGLEPMAKEAGLYDANGELTGFKDQTQPKQPIHFVAVPISSPNKFLASSSQPTILPKASTVQSPMILNSSPSQRLSLPQIISSSSRGSTVPMMLDSPGILGAIRKRGGEIEIDFGDSKRRKGEKGGKGLRHFSMKVCEKVQKKGVTSYNEVADELVAEFSDPRHMTPTDQQYDQKNIRRRVYDALNVLMAMNIISKEKKEIRWIGLPTNSAQECQNLELEKQRRLERIRHKTQQLQELILQQIAFKNLVNRNRDLEKTQGPPTANSAIQLPFIIVNTSKKTVIDCSISNDKYEYLFNFDNTFEIHDDIEVLKRMGMAFGLEKNSISEDHLSKAMKMVPKSLEPYVLQLANVPLVAGSSGIKVEASASSSNLTNPPYFLTSGDSTDAEVAMATSHMSRQSSLGSFSDVAPSRGATETPSECFSDDDEDESERSSPVDIN